MKIPIRHIGIPYMLCSKKKPNPRMLRSDLEYKRYKQLGVSERYRGEEKYRICKKCLKIIWHLGGR